MDTGQGAQMNKTPTVSVIIPTYNRERLIGRAIQSVLNQTYGDFEVIVVDDGSTDNTKNIVGAINDPRIRYIRHEQQKGATTARNTGIVASQGKYIAFQDSDDEWLSEKLEKQMHVLEAAPEDVGVIYTAFIRVTDGEVLYIPSTRVVKKEGDVLTQLLKQNFVSTQTAILRKSCFDRVGLFDERLPRLQDWELFIRMSQYYKFRFISDPLVIAHFQKDSISSSKKAYIEGIVIILEKHFEKFAKNKKVLAKTYCDIGTKLYSVGNKNRGRDYIIKAMKSHPVNVTYLIAFCVTFFGVNVFYFARNFYRKNISQEKVLRL
jgi:glycosyltransferase involved in cell wall biosynthesis